MIVECTHKTANGRLIERFYLKSNDLYEASIRVWVHNRWGPDWRRCKKGVWQFREVVSPDSAYFISIDEYLQED